MRALGVGGAVQRRDVPRPHCKVEPRSLVLRRQVSTSRSFVTAQCTPLCHDRVAWAVRILCSRMVAELEADFIERLAMLQRSRMSSLHVAAIAQARLAKLC